MPRPTIELHVVLAGLSACTAGPLVPVDPATDSCVSFPLTIPHPEEIDLLFVVDDSPSMADEQDLLAEQIPVLIDELLDPPLDPESGNPMHVPLGDLHVGVITTDLEGDGGILVTESRTGSGCAAMYPSWLAYQSEEPDPEAATAMGRDVGCLASAGTDGSDFEQPLEAALVALTENAGPGRPNEGFLRPDSRVAVVFVTDEDDCSVHDPLLFDPALGPPDLACAGNPEMLHPIERYIDWIQDLRHDPEAVFLSFIIGVPQDLMCEGFGDQIPNCLDHPEMEPAANHPRRLVQISQTMGYLSHVSSIHDPDLDRALRGLAAGLAPFVWDWVFMPDIAVAKDPADPCRCVTTCTIVEVPESEGCPEGTTPLGPGVDTECIGTDLAGRLDRPVCVIPQAGMRLEDCTMSCDDPTAAWTIDGEGWAAKLGYWSGFPIEFSEGMKPTRGSTAYIGCSRTFCPAHRECTADGAPICCPAGRYCAADGCRPVGG